MTEQMLEELWHISGHIVTLRLQHRHNPITGLSHTEKDETLAQVELLKSVLFLYCLPSLAESESVNMVCNEDEPRWLILACLIFTLLKL